MKNNLTLRPAKLNDWKLTYRFKKEGLKSYVEKIWSWNETEQKKLHKEEFEPEKTQIILFKEVEIGYLSMKKSVTEVYIENLIFLTKYQNKGLGTNLMNHIIEDAEHENLMLRLKVLKTNIRAKKFYDTLGFEKNSETKYHYELRKRPTYVSKEIT